MRLLLHVQPGAAATAVAGWHDGRVRIRLAAKPVEGAANDALVRFLAQACRVPRTRVTVAAGHRGRRKTVVLGNVSVAAVTGGLGLEGAGPPLSSPGSSR